MEKVIFIVCDGISDRPIAEFDRKTPLEAAFTPNLDQLTKRGISGVMHTIDIGIRPGSDVSHLALFGYDPLIYYTGRGPFEVAGLGMELKKGDVAFRVNAGTVDEKMLALDRRAGRIDDTTPLAEILNGTVIEEVEFLLKPGTGHRLGLIMRGKDLSGKISDADPHVSGVKVYQVKPLDESPEAKRTAKILNQFLEFAHHTLKEAVFNQRREKQGLLPANYLLVRGAGMTPKLPGFKEKYGLKACCLAGAGLYKGIGRLLGMKVVEVPGATGKTDSKIENKIKKALELIDRFDFFFIHFKAADTLAEDGDYQGKKEFIEKIDRAVKPLLDLKNALIVITADHSTACNLKAHTADDVPVTIISSNVRDDEVERFGERTCAKGRLGHLKGIQLMPIIIDLMGLAQLFGA